jgi:aminoglycoside phosphotransferase (APT) family kinase protein
VPLERRAATFEQNLAAVAALVDRDAVLAAWAAALAVPAWDRAPVWLHGDPHPANILIRDGAVSAVIDWGDVTAGDPASDLSLVWMLLPAACHDRFRAAYAKAGGEPVSDATWARGRGWALNLAIVFLAWSADNPRLHEVGRRTLAAVLAG